MRILHAVAFSKYLRWLAKTKVITLKTQLHAVNARWKRLSQLSLKYKRRRIRPALKVLGHKRRKWNYLDFERNQFFPDRKWRTIRPLTWLGFFCAAGGNTIGYEIVRKCFEKFGNFHENLFGICDQQQGQGSYRGPRKG